ncbi:site-specific DNA-methyltransferase [Eubacterium sp.]|uniref:site-specific DNA-methyltransferase n=1 Tax=Eubacterium sp. TaxID=142586 RepID=UPI0025B81A4F|nr:site-specific DNA-methyltransferase [Eubacterium sp.]
MDKLKMQTANKADENFKKVAEMFPNAVTEAIDENGEVVRAIDKDVLMQEISCKVVDGNEERYQFTWPDKKNFVLLANAPINKTLRPCREESVDFDNTENLYIEGDNLEVLKLLQETYLGKIKMIYIDPPYNTGNDFVYEDDFAQSTDEYFANSGQYDEDGNRMVQNTESNGRFHTDWLNMIYPRLKLAKDLLSDDGVIFISIDDNESSNIKKICDEIFGVSNYINQIAWVSNITGRQISGTGAAKTWESVFVYCKNAQSFYSLTVDITFAKEKMPDSYKGFNKDIRKDGYGPFAIGDTLYNHNRKFNEETRPNLVFSIFYNPDTEEIITGNIGEVKEGFIELLPHKNGDGIHKYHAWRWSKPKIAKESYNLIVLPTSNGGYEIYTRIRDFNTTLLKDIITNISNGDSEVQKLFGGKKYFEYPKSVDLISTFISSISDKSAIILDFFSGSATTAHAVMKLNAEDSGHRKFIMVQLPEGTDEKSEAYKAGYKNICEIGKERIRRAGNKILEEATQETADIAKYGESYEVDEIMNKYKNLDVGFRVLKCDSSNMKDVYYNPAEYEQSLFSRLEDNIKEDRTPEDLLFQVMLDLGVLLSSKIEETTIAGKKVFNVEDNYLIACFDDNVTEDVITEIAKLKPYYFVMRDSSMANDSVATNFEQIFASYSPDTVRKVL